MTLRKHPTAILLVSGLVAAGALAPVLAQKAGTGNPQDPRTQAEQTQTGKADAPRQQASDPKRQEPKKGRTRAAEEQPDEPEEEDDR